VNMVKLFKSFFGRWSHLRGAPLGEFAVKQWNTWFGGASIRYRKFFYFLIELQNLNFIRGFCACIMYIWFGLISVLRGTEFHGKSSM
jgi:hypothetical protein